MNTPDREKIEDWMSGRLSGLALEDMENWAAKNPEALERLIGWEATGKMLRGSIPNNVQPPYPDFFNSKIHQMIENDEEGATISNSRRSSFWQRFGWAAAIVGMALCFYVGSTLQMAPVETEMVGDSEIYIPQKGVSVEVSETENITVIALSGLPEIPEELDIVNGETSDGSEGGGLVMVEDVATF